jgi:hypothetical protein
MKYGEESNPLERELRAALGREAPPPGFTERVLRAAADDRERRLAASARRWNWFEWPRVPRAAWAGALCAVLITGVWMEREHQRQVEGEQAKERLMLALRVTGTQLNQVRRLVRETGVNADLAR